MTRTYTGIEWDYDNLSGITYSSSTLDEPYETWLYSITGVSDLEEESSFSLSDGVSYKETNTVRETLIKFNENRHLLVTKSVDEQAFSVDDNDYYNRIISQSIHEPITVSEQRPIESVGIKKKEDVAFFLDESRYITTDRNGNQTVYDQTEVDDSISLFDFEVSSYPLSRSNFESWVEGNAPINYNDVRPFIPGEYEYKNAYAGFKLSISPTEGRFGVYGSTVYVDVEDTVEKGFAEASSGSLTRVSFSKRFYTSPHIMSSLVYATENCYVEIPTVTKEYFEFGLKSISTGQYLAGEISWLADGY